MSSSHASVRETVCVSKVHQTEEIVHLELAQSISSGVNIRIDINGFISADSGPNVYKQIPNAKWRVPQMIGSVFEPASARHVFPSLDLHNQKATFNLCVNHGPSMTAISNSLINPNISTTGISCFDKTVPLTAQQLSFVAFEKTNPLFYNTTTLDGAYLPEIDMIFNSNSKNFQQYEWIHSEVSKVMSLMSKWSDFSYPLSRLEIVVAPVMVGHSALGVITLPAQAIAYQKHTSTHETIIKEVIGQWMEGVVTTEHTCFEKALIAYLEWKINEELQIVKKTRKMEVSRIRPRNLNETADQLRVIRQIKGQSTTLCSPRFVEVFYTLDETYGQESVIGMIKEIFDKFAFSTVTISDWASAAQTSTKKEEAGALIHEWYRPSTKISRPVLRAVVSSNGIEFNQLTEDNWTVPLEISGSAGTQIAVITEKKQSIPFVSTDYVVVDAQRKSHAFVVYDADTYLRLIRCFGDSRCPSKEIGGAFSDLGAALLANILPKPENHEVAKWKSVFKFMAQQNLVEGTAACCVEHAIREMRKCSYWDIQDVCTKIDFNTVLAAVA
uniref:Peptidase_M1_N domain-containing protein n=1 Tax=Caenorhabditis tropicalis TaxID=1561998 RepID=A0A1I7V391_9PELO